MEEELVAPDEAEDEEAQEDGGAVTEHQPRAKRQRGDRCELLTRKVTEMEKKVESRAGEGALDREEALARQERETGLGEVAHEDRQDGARTRRLARRTTSCTTTCSRQGCSRQEALGEGGQEGGGDAQHDRGRREAARHHLLEVSFALRQQVGQVGRYIDVLRLLLVLIIAKRIMRPLRVLQSAEETRGWTPMCSHLFFDFIGRNASERDRRRRRVRRR